MRSMDTMSGARHGPRQVARQVTKAVVGTAVFRPNTRELWSTGETTSTSTEGRPNSDAQGCNRGCSVKIPRIGRTHYHRQYLAQNPGGYRPDRSCGVSIKSAELQVGEKAQS